MPRRRTIAWRVRRAAADIGLHAQFAMEHQVAPGMHAVVFRAAYEECLRRAQRCRFGSVLPLRAGRKMKEGVTINHQLQGGRSELSARSAA